MDIEVTFDGTGFFGGEYLGDIIVSSNDPDESEVSVSASLNVTGAPSISISDDNLEFGDLFVDGSLTLEVEVSNIGTDLLVIENIESDNEDFSVGTDYLELGPDESHMLSVTFAPSYDGYQDGSVVFISNDPSNPEIYMSVSGTGLLPPDIDVDPLSLSADLYTGDIDSSQTFTIYNLSLIHI